MSTETQFQVPTALAKSFNTMTKYLAIALLVTVLAGNAYGDDEIYYCAETDANGYVFDKTLKKYRIGRFNVDKFKIKFDRTAKTLEIKGHPLDPINKTYPCTTPYGHRPELLSCTSSLYHFNFNSDNGRFVLGMLYGYVAGDEDTISVSYGTCDRF
jgi:hypothetical protein